MFRDFLMNFWARKTRRERALLIIALLMCGAYGVVEFIYAPLLEKRSALKSAYAHARAELERMQDVAKHHHSKQEMRSAQEREEAERVRGEVGMMVATIEGLQERDFASGHSALSVSNSSLGNHSRDCGDLEVVTTAKVAPTPKSPQSPQSNTANTRIVGGEILESKGISESTPPVIASAAKQSTDSEKMDCHAGKPARNDSKIETRPLQNLESKADSELPSGGVYLHRDKNKIARSANLEGVVGGERYICERIARGEGATSPNSSPSPLDEKEKEILKNSGILEVKARDSEKLDSESENKVESAMVGDSEKRDLKSEKIESAIDSESTPSVIASSAKQSIKQDSESVDCHAGKPARNDDRLDSQSIDCRNSAPAESRNDNTHTATKSRQDSESQKGKGGDSKIVDYRATDSKHQESGALNIYALMSELINLANEQHISLSAIIPHAPTQSLTLQGSASFSQLKLLLARLESYRFASLENVSLEPLATSALGAPSEQEGAASHSNSTQGAGTEGVRFSLLAQLYPPRALLGGAR